MSNALHRGRVTLNRNQLREHGRLRIIGIRAPFPQYSDDPVGFAQKVLGHQFLTQRQKEVMESVRDNRVTNVPAGHGVGKTFVAALIVLWWVFARGGYVVTTAPSERQVKRLLWREIRKAYDENQWQLGGARDQMQVYLSEDAQAFGFAGRAYDPDSTAGFHHEDLLAVVDEANGITSPLDDAVVSWASGAKNRLLRIGNATKDGTPFARACARQGAILISCFDHPNTEWAYDPYGVMHPEVIEAIMFEDEDGALHVRPRDEWPKDYREYRKDKVEGAVSIEWLEDVRRSLDKGEGSVYWQGHVRGLFPSDSSTMLVPRTWFMAARKRYDANKRKCDREARSSDWYHGLDIGDGVDDHCRATRRGDTLYEVEVVVTKGDRKDNTRAVAIVIATHDGSVDRPPRPGVWNIDRIGVGTGVVSTLLTDEDYGGSEITEDSRNVMTVHGIHIGSRATSAKNRKLYKNLRAQIMWGLRTRFEDGTIAIAPLGRKLEQRLMEELANTEWDRDAQGKVVIEPKDEVRDKIGHSTDILDATALAYHETGSRQKTASHW